MPTLLRASPWRSAELPLQNPLAASTSQAWCSAASRATQWTLDTCDAVLNSATFVAEQHGGASVENRQRILCNAVVSETDVSVDQGIPERSSQQPESRGLARFDPAVVFPSVVSLAIIAYLLHLIRLERHYAPVSVAKPSRCGAVDVFRGMAICLMVFVNYGGGGFDLFLHSTWNGLTIADVVFPCFAWIMGFTMSLGMRNARIASPWRRIVARSAKLFALGLFLNNGPSWAEWRIPGVLQSLSIGYLLTACSTRVVGSLLSRKLHRERSCVLEVVAHSLLGVFPIVTANLVATFGLRVPGCPTGYLGPGGDSDGGQFRHCTGGAHLYVDRVVFGERHIYQTPTCQQAFHTGPYDPEGLLNWLMVAATTYCGFVAGSIFTAMVSTDRRTRVRASLVQAATFFLTSAAVSGGFVTLPHTHWIPVNKNLWSVSYVLVSVAVAHAVFALLLFFGAGEPTTNAWLPLTTWSHVGQNSIFIYVAHEIVQSYAPFSPKPMAFAAVPQLVVLLQNVAGVLWWILVAEWMHTRGIFLAV